MVESVDDLVLDYARGITDSIDPSIRSVMLLLYPHRNLAVWRRVVPYSTADGRLTEDGLVLAHALVLLDERSSTAERSEAARFLHQNFIETLGSDTPE